MDLVAIIYGDKIQRNDEDVLWKIVITLLASRLKTVFIICSETDYLHLFLSKKRIVGGKRTFLHFGTCIH